MSQEQEKIERLSEELRQLRDKYAAEQHLTKRLSAQLVKLLAERDQAHSGRQWDTTVERALRGAGVEIAPAKPWHEGPGPDDFGGSDY